jgi:hypothetical protein
MLIAAITTLGCKYIVVPDDLIAKRAEHGSWDAVITNAEILSSDILHIDITIRNDSGDWSTMAAVEQKPAILNSGGATVNCNDVIIGTGGHRFAPGLQMRGYTTGSKADPEVQLLYIECNGVDSIDPQATISFDYIAFNGPLDYYHQDDNRSTGTIQLSLGEVESILEYPIYEVIEGVITPADADIPAISNNVVNLVDAQRTEIGLQFFWKNHNPTNFALTTHIGTPPVIGEDGVIYGIFQIMDIAPVPMTPAGGDVEWTTEVSVPPEIKGLYILMSVEDRQMRLYVNHLIDITDK